MDDEDSQDELINRNISHGKGKRPNTSIVSDEEEYGDDSHEESTDSEDDDSQDGEDEGGEEEEEEDESEREDGVKELEEVIGTEPADLGLSSDEDAEKCPICLNSFHEQPVATPQNCEHYFCLDCILEWAKNANSCPVDRTIFSKILLRKCYGGKVQKTITIQRPATQEQEEQVNVDLEQTSCEVCGGTDREDRLLLCDGCDAGYHMECLTPPLDAVPVEEWFCPECAPNNRNRRTDQLSEEEISVLPTTSRSPPAGSRPTRAIARTQHSERVRANVNRHRITQARTAAQLVPQYMMQSTWLDETINAVVAGLNTAMYVRDLTPRPRARRRRKRAPKKKTVKEQKDIKGKTSTTKVNRRKRKARRKRFRKKVVAKKKSTSQGRIAQSLGIKNPSRGSAVPSVYRSCEQTLSSMRSDIGAPPLYIFGNPFDIDPVDDGDEEMEQAPVQPSLLEAKRRGLSRSALRSHQPVARPILAGLSRGGSSIPQLEEIAEAAPDPDLLGSILSAQSLLLMDSSDVVINRDGSLKARKSASLERTPSTEAADFHSSSPLRNSSQSSLQPTPAPVTVSTCCPGTSHAPASVLDHPRLSTPLPRRPTPANTTGTGHHQCGSGSIRDQPPARLTNAAPDSHLGERRSTTNIPAKKPPPKPAWVDVSVLPKIPKIKRDSSSVAHGSTGSNSNNFPESSVTSLAGDKGRQNSVDQQRSSENRQGRPADSQSQRLDRAVRSSSFSNSFSTPSTSASVTSNSQPSSSSAISFRISSSRNPWHIRRLSAPDQTLVSKDKSSVKKNQKNKQMLLLSYSHGKKDSVESEVYDPFNPTGSDASDSEKETENDKRETSLQSPPPRVQTGGQIEDAKHEIKTESVDEHEIKTESMDLDLPVDNEMSGMMVHVKKEPASPKDDPWSSPSHQPATLLSAQSESLSALVAYSGSPVVSDGEDRGNSEAQLTTALGHSRSSSLSSHHSDQEVKIEVKSKPDVEPSPVKSTPPVVPQAAKGNGFIHEISSVSGNSDVNHKGNEKEIPQSPCVSSGEEKRLQCASSSPPYKASEQSDKQKKHSRPTDRRWSHSRSPRRRQSRSRSREQSRLRDRRRSTRSSSSESSRKRRRKHESRDCYDSREKEGQKRYKKKRYHHSRSRSRSKSRSRSRSRERRRERTFSHRSSRSRDRHEIRSKRKRSRSTSRDRKQRDNVSEGPRYRKRHTEKSVASLSTEENEPNRSTDRNALLLKELQTGQSECDATLSGVAIKKETDTSSQENSQLTEQSGEQILEDVLSINVSHESYELKPETEIKEDAKEEEMENEKEHPSSKESQLINYQPPEQVKVEQIWPDDENSSSDDDALVINLSSPGPAPTDSEKMTDCEPISLSVVPKEEVKVESLQASCQLKQEPVDSSDEEINVDYLIDNLDFIKKEMKDEPETGGAEEAQANMDKESAEVKQEMESVLVMAGTKAKSQGKRVTWNIQEPVVSQPDKMSKLALFKLKLKQEGSRKAASSSSIQITGQVATAVQGGSKSAASSVSSPALEGRLNAGQEKSKSHKEELLQNPDHKDKYLKKLHMQERAIEEVKLAIKPFYQKRDITKEEYKEILRKAVQKVCHSKSGEINPVKVTNLVKAYVDKYKHARKHRKAEDKQTAEAPQGFGDSRDTA